MVLVLNFPGLSQLSVTAVVYTTEDEQSPFLLCLPPLSNPLPDTHIIRLPRNVKSPAEDLEPSNLAACTLQLFSFFLSGYPVYLKIMIMDEKKAFDRLSQLSMDYYLNAQQGYVRILPIL